MNNYYKVIAGMLVLALMTSSLAYAGAMGSTWSEDGDAGDSLMTANVPTNTGPLEHIVGTLPDADINGVDMYHIYIPDPSQFFASTDNYPATELLDSWLYLFDESGNGIAASGSSSDGWPNAVIRAGSLSVLPGKYYLAVTRLDSAPESVSGLLFPDLSLAAFDGQVYGPTGPGGGAPLASWSSSSTLSDNENYQIDLVGAFSTVPEPSSALIWMSAALASTFYRRRRLER